MPGKSSRNAIWLWINSPIAITLISGGLLAGGAKIYSDRQADQANIELRRDAYVDMIAEYEQRVSLLSEADGRLDEFVGAGRNFKGGRHIPSTGPARREFEHLSLKVGTRELAILKGNGGYTPTTPEFANIDMLTLASRMERTAGIPDIQLGSLRVIRTLDAPPEILWLMVRAHLPMMQEFAVTRHTMFTNGPAASSPR